MNNKIQDIKRSQKEALFLRELSKMFHNICLDDNRLDGLFINRVELSGDKSLCRVFMYTSQGHKKYEEQLEFLKLYKPSLRKGLGQTINSRYVPDIRFFFDAKFEKQNRLETLLHQVSEDNKGS